MSTRVVILGAAGRDFHDFQMFFRSSTHYRVWAFTAAQISFIHARTFPQTLAGPEYETDIPIFPEDQLPELIRRFDIDFVFLAYSDLSQADILQKISLVQACGAAFAALGPRQTQLRSSKPTITVTAVRTGAGKSPLTQYLAKFLKDKGWRVGVLRHPMPYGNLTRQLVERFATVDDLERFSCTVEEREEFEPYIEAGVIVYAGVDYCRLLEIAESQNDVLLWDGGNNDYPFVRPDLAFVIADALRPGHEVAYYPGATNFRSADIVVINKVGHARPEDIRLIRDNAAKFNPRADVLESDLEIEADRPERLTKRRVLVVEDGPTLTHGGMAFGAGLLTAKKWGAAELVDPRRAAFGSIAEVYERYPHLSAVLPALGYSPQQCRELEQTIHRSDAEIFVDASPARLDRVLNLRTPVVRVCYRFRQIRGTPIESIVDRFLNAQSRANGSDQINIK